jgi:hypothetical protein
VDRFAGCFLVGLKPELAFLNAEELVNRFFALDCAVLGVYDMAFLEIKQRAASGILYAEHPSLSSKPDQLYNVGKAKVFKVAPKIQTSSSSFAP